LGSSRTNCTQYSGELWCKQLLRLPLVVTLPFCPGAPEWVQTSRHCFYGSIWRSEPAAETVSAKCIFPGNSGAGTDTLPNRRSQDIETGWRTWFTPPNLSGRPKPSGSLIIAKGHT
jgi:hypothetical protein